MGPHGAEGGDEAARNPAARRSLRDLGAGMVIGAARYCSSDRRSVRQYFEACMQHSILTQPVAARGLRHDPVTIALHWVTAALVVALWTIGQTVDVFPNGPLRIDYRSVHILLGVILAVVVLGRLAWRLARRAELPPIDDGLLLVIARVTHWALYALLVVTVGLGGPYAWARGDSIFNVFTIPQMVPGDRALAHQIGDWHALAANALLIVAGVHAAAALFHHYILRDETLRRMLPWEPR
jgi:cytochrome b561